MFSVAFLDIFDCRAFPCQDENSYEEGRDPSHLWTPPVCNPQPHIVGNGSEVSGPFQLWDLVILRGSWLREGLLGGYSVIARPFPRVTVSHWPFLREDPPGAGVEGDCLHLDLPCCEAGLGVLPGRVQDFCPSFLDGAAFHERPTP